MVGTTDTFNPQAFERLKKAEERHFWFHIRRKWIFDRLRKFIEPPAKVLEVGCGTGNVSSFLAKKGYTVTGCEYFHEAISMAWPRFVKVQGDARNLPFESSSFDIVGLFDILEHFQNDMTPLQEAGRVLKNGGIMVITVPAREELWSYRDEKALHKRRYSKEILRKNLLETNLTPLCIEYMFMSLYFPIRYIWGGNKKIDNQFMINRFMNALLKGTCEIERLISKNIALPVGTSLIAVAKKNA